MNKTQLVAEVAEKAGLTKKDSAKAVEAVFACIQEAMMKNDKVQLIGFGTFEVKDRPARTVLNPRTRERVEVAASRKPIFKAGKQLKDNVNANA